MPIRPVIQPILALGQVKNLSDSVTEVLLVLELFCGSVWVAILDGTVDIVIKSRDRILVRGFCNCLDTIGIIVGERSDGVSAVKLRAGRRNQVTERPIRAISISVRC